jgi:hypothetical protein
MIHARDAVVFNLECHAYRRCDPTLGDEFGKLRVDFVRCCAGGDSLRLCVDLLLERNKC